MEAVAEPHRTRPSRRVWAWPLLLLLGVVSLFATVVFPMPWAVTLLALAALCCIVVPTADLIVAWACRCDPFEPVKVYR